MGMYINSATSSMALTRSLYQTSVMQTNIMKRLSSGIRINSASDDAAGLSLSQKLTSVINGNNVAKNNTQTGISFLNTADGALSVMTNSLERIRNLAVQSSNGVYSSSERQMMDKEVQQLSADIRQTYQGTTFGSKNVFTGSDGAAEYNAAISAGYNAAHIITTTADFVSKINADRAGNFILTSDVDLSSLGTKTNSLFTGTFSGTLDGNGHKIQNFHIDTAGAAIDNIGLFQFVSGTIKNLSIEGFSVTANNSNYIGGLVGQITGGNVNNCYANGTMTTQNTSGLLAGYNNGGQILNSSTAGSLTGTGWSASGLVGWNDAGGLVSRCYSTASVADTGGHGDASGLVGYNTGGATTSECYFSGSATSAVTIYASVGGIVGENDGGNVTDCYSTGNVSVTGSGGIIGGVVGGNNIGSNVTNCYATGTVTWTNLAQAGGVVGDNFGVVDASNFYKNNMSQDIGSSVNANISPQPTSGWSSAIWDTSGALPTLKNTIGPTLSPTLHTSGGTLQIQIGADANSTSQIALNTSFDLGALTFDVSNQASAKQTIDFADKLMTFLNTTRSGIGSDANKLTSILNIQDNRIINISSSKSTINDSDMAIESANLVKNQIRNQAATTLMAQTKNLDKNLLMSLLGE